jgi:copper chaperone CopZ
MLVAFMFAGTTFQAQDSIKPVEKKEEVKKTDKKKKTEDVTFVVNMTCENCKARIEKHITWEKGVKNLKVNLDKKTVEISYDQKKTDEAALKKAIEALGYTCEVSASNSDKN